MTIPDLLVALQAPYHEWANDGGATARFLTAIGGTPSHRVDIGAAFMDSGVVDTIPGDWTLGLNAAPHEGRMTLELASIKVDSDGQVAEIKLHENAAWHMVQPIVAAALKYADLRAVLVLTW